MRRQHRVASVATLGFGLAVTIGCGGVEAAPAIPVPEIHDADLELQLFAHDPDIVTPVGLAVDGRGRVFVAESHTHSPPAGYPGPAHDRIKVLEDLDDDGRADRITVFSEGLQKDVMNLAFGPDGTLYVVDASGVSAYVDRDGDGRADDHRRLLELECPSLYDHSALLGIAVDRDGDLYLSRGNVAGQSCRYRTASGQSFVTYGDGGHILRLRRDGSRLERIATGFWNPFALVIDGRDRLLAIDNDPDSRGPNRLLHIVPGGDYGYRARYGGSGLHPYVAWNGELPGTLPFIAGVGESPAGLLDANQTALPARFRDNLLVTVWAENTIERFAPNPRGVSLQARRQLLVKGDRDFRPVALHAAPDGSVYISDWVKKEYPNHGKGRVWRLRTRPGVRSARLSPRTAFAAAAADAGTATLSRLLAGDVDYARLRRALVDADPFVQAVARHRLAEPRFRKALLADAEHGDAAVRLGVLTTLRWAGGPAYPLPALPLPMLRRRLGDPDQRVRQLALVLIGESAALAARAWLPRALAGIEPSPELLQVYLATTALLTPAERRHLSRRLPRSTGGDGVSVAAALNVVRGKDASDGTLAMVLPYIDADAARTIRALLSTKLRAGSVELQAQVLRTLALVETADTSQILMDVARDRARARRVRMTALALLESRPDALAKVAELVGDDDVEVATVAARSLRLLSSDEAVRAQLSKAQPATGALAEALTAALDPEEAMTDARRPATPAAWASALAAAGDAVRGEFVFASARTGCLRCHRVNARGGRVGPDLTHIASSVDRARLLDSILNPSGEVSPEFQAYAVETRAGESYVGTQWHLRGPNAGSLLLLDGAEKRFRLDELTSYAALDTSLMPQGLELALTIEELRDLLAYLATLR